MSTIHTITGLPGGKPLSLQSRSWQRSGFVGRFVLVLTSLAMWVGGMLQRRRSRLALLEMTDDQLKDIGISRCDAHREGIRPFWD
jgi:uncharacterized protein YjiS (DUF1127 family)